MKNIILAIPLNSTDYSEEKSYLVPLKTIFPKVKHTNTLNKTEYKHFKNCSTVIEAVRKMWIKFIPTVKRLEKALRDLETIMCPTIEEKSAGKK